MSGYFLNEFFKGGWTFFYRFTLTYLKALSSRILQIDESENDEMLDLIKTPFKATSSSAISEQSDELTQSISS